MNKKYVIATLALLAAFLLKAVEAKDATEIIEKTLSFGSTSKSRQLVVDNINGSIEVMGHSGDKVKLKVRKTISARSATKLDEAKTRIKLDIREQGDAIVLYVDTPYRKSDGSINHRGWRYYGYDVTYDFVIKVPFDVDLILKTINDGEIKVKQTRGNFEIDNTNGGIEAAHISGSGRIYALNGDVTVSFAKNPQADCSFGSLNGEINVTFLPELSADFRIKTFNGDVFTDFDVSHLKSRPATQKRKRGKYVYKSDKAFGARVGNGGPEIEFDGFNGDIYIAKK